ncbi:glutamate receptor 4-like [Anneissia japonica]|uniref:glutamate receptor 4-like n=1 Tax=Anneissia japonica TaxID=1529436 RepID=UPI001425675D|nr:glutamate receptor 4-like [Anneissia japonica]
MWLFFCVLTLLLCDIIRVISGQDSGNASMCKIECPEPFNPDFARAGIILNIGSSKAKFDGNLVLNCSFARAILEHNKVFDEKLAPFTTMAVLRYTDVNNPRELERELCWQISNFNILGGHMAPATLPVIDAYSRTLGVPYITSNLSPKELFPNKNFDFTWSLKPSLVLPLLDIIQHYSPERIAYLYADEEAFLRYQNVKSNLSNSFMNSTIFKKITNNIRDDLGSLRDEGWTFYVVDAPVKTIQSVLNNAGLLGMVTSSYNFVVMNLNANKLKVDSFVYGGMNLTAFQLPINQTNDRLMNLTLNCSGKMNNNTNATVDRPDADAILLHDLSLVLLNAFEKVLAKYSYMPVSQRSQCYCSKHFDSSCCSRLRKNECLMSCCCLQKLAESDVDAHSCTQGRTYVSALQEMVVDGLSGSIQFDNVTGERTAYTLEVIGIKDLQFLPIATWNSDRKVRLQLANFTEPSDDVGDEEELLKRELIVTSILCYQFTSLCLLHHIRRSVGGRLVGAVWWFFTLIFIASYTANLAAFLTIEVMIPAINSVEDLTNQSIIKYGAVLNASTMEFFKNSKTPVLTKIWDGMKEDANNFAADNKEGVERVRHSKGKYAFFLESSVNEFNNQREPCDTMKIGPNLDSKGYGIAFSKEKDWLRFEHEYIFANDLIN